MNTCINFFDEYKNLPTTADQKNVRHLILKEGKIKKVTFYSWAQRGDIPDEKAKDLAIRIIIEYKQELLISKI